MLILGVDPGLRATGFAVVEGGTQGVRLLEHGVIHTDDGAPLPLRLRRIHDELHGLIARVAPAQMAVEDLYAAQRFPRTAILMGHVRGVVCLAAAVQAVDVAALPPSAVKHAISGFGGASKAQIQMSVKRLLHVDAALDGHAADAAAMALTALSRAGVALLPARPASPPVLTRSTLVPRPSPAGEAGR